MSKDKCKEYYEALMIDPLLEVTPTMALAETFTAFIVQPLEHLGRHIGKFFNALLQETSWLSSPVILTFVFIAILLCLVMIFNYRFRLPFFLGSFEPRTNLSDSFTLERKEQQKMMLELKTQIHALKDANTPQKHIHLTSLANPSSRIEELQCEQVQQHSIIKTMHDPKNIPNINDSSSCDINYLSVKRKKQTHTNLIRANSSPSKLCFNEDVKSQSLLDNLNPFDFTDGNPVNKTNTESSIESDDADFIAHDDSMSQTNNPNFENASSSYLLSPVKKLVVKKNDQDPKETDFEWITDMLNDKLVAAQVESTETQNDGCENNSAIEPEGNDFLNKAKSVFKDVLES